MKKSIIWVLAIIITLGSAYYQRKTGPTYPKKVSIELNGNTLNFKLPRSAETGSNLKITIPKTDTTTQVTLFYKRYPVNESFVSTQFTNQNNEQVSYLPWQPPAGKLEYYLCFSNSTTQQEIKTEPVVIRFKGIVPTWALLPHVLFMFIAMLLSNLAGLFAIAKTKEHIFYGRLTLFLLLLGGLIFGPIVQHFAFGQAWTGIPLGWDLTDNKTLIAVLFWLVAVLANRKNPKYRNTIIAAAVLFLIYIIPHSLLGSELDYESGKVVTGIISLF
ncbi:MAG TPA: PPC domain-containing protein [Bacteroidales bacterium]|nr:PPC domain-containing protein [Bacteroidales bacterium]